MKRILLSILALILFSTTAYAQTFKYKTTDFAYKTYDFNTGIWSDWSDWESSDMLVVISLDREVINIYSEEMQEYDIFDYEGTSTDASGGESMTFNCVDRDGLRCNIRLRIQSDGIKQLYVDYNDIMWVYSMVEKQ